MTTASIFFALAVFPLAVNAAPSVPNDCWSGLMAPDKSPNGRFIATGPVSQWRVGVPLVVYATRETNEEVFALLEKGKTGTYDTARPITVIPTWISGPEPGDKDSQEDKNIEVTLDYRTAQGETGIINLTYWTPLSGHDSSLSPAQEKLSAEIDQLLHDMGCRGIP